MPISLDITIYIKNILLSIHVIDSSFFNFWILVGLPFSSNAVNCSKISFTFIERKNSLHKQPSDIIHMLHPSLKEINWILWESSFIGSNCYQDFVFAFWFCLYTLLILRCDILAMFKYLLNVLYLNNDCILVLSLS